MYGVLILLYYNFQVCGFGVIVIDIIIYMDVVLCMPSLVANVCNCMHPHFINGESSIFKFKVPLIPISVLNHDVWYIIILACPRIRVSICLED